MSYENLYSGLVFFRTQCIFYTFTQSLCHCNKFQSHHNSHTGHCYVISFGAGKRLDVIIITIMKHMQCSVSCPPCKRWGSNFFSASGTSEIVPPSSKPWRHPCYHSRVGGGATSPDGRRRRRADPLSRRRGHFDRRRRSGKVTICA